VVDDPTLRAQIETEVLATIPEPLTGMIDRMVADLRDRGVTPGIAVGEHAPGFEAPDVRGELVRLDDRLATGPVVLTFYRGAWCPICNLELRALQAILPQLGAAGASLVAISPQGPDASLPLVESLDLGFDVLSDLDQSIIGAYRLRFELPDELKAVYEQVEMPLTSVNADTSWYLPVAATFVIDADGVVRARHVDSDHRTRMEPRDVLAAVAEVTR
jgi:peroxiredoxin